MKKLYVILALFLSIYIDKAFSIFRTVEAGRYYFYTFSPELLSRGMGIVGFDSPSSIVINPASNAFIQNIKLDTSTGFAPAFFSTIKEPADFFAPFILNTSFVIPTKYGNFSALFNYSNMSNLNFKKEFNLPYGNYNELNYGKVGTFYFNFSKDYLEKFAFGFNANVKIGYNPASKYENNKFDVASSLNLGFIFKPEWYLPFSKKRATNWGFQNFQAAITLTEIGKPFINMENGINGDYDIYWFPAPFTPAIGFSIDLYNDSLTYWRILCDASSPFFQNLTFSLGTELQIFKFLVLRGSYTFDLEGVLEYSKVIPKYENLYNIANFSAGASFRIEKDMFKKGERDKGNSYSIDFGIKPYHQGVILLLGSSITFGVKDKKAPDIKIIQKNSYISPNFDGIQDELILNLDIKDQRYVVFWKFDIYNEKGEIIRTIESKKPRQESKKVKDIVKEYFSPKSGIPIPREIIWDGTDKDGNIVKDGTYTFKVTAMDDNKNISSAIGKVVVDLEKPEVKANIINNIFSPNDDGVKDTLIIDINIIKQNSSSVIIEKSDTEKQIWYVDVLDNKNNLIRRYSFTEKGTFKLEWDGKDQNGNRVQDGIYQIKLHSTDLAGNYWENIIQNIVVDTQIKPINVVLLNNFFSPNGDNIKDEVLFQTDIPMKTGIEGWKFEIYDEIDSLIKTETGKGIPPANLKWDGKNQNGLISKEGKYKAKLSITYISGNLSTSTTPLFTLDTTPPYCEISIDDPIFSPNGDGKKDFTTIVHSKATEESEWRATIFDEKGSIVKTFIWKNSPPNSIAWDGKDNNGRLLKDGKYFYSASSTDEAGNIFVSKRYEITISTIDIPVFITYYYESFSPNSDGVLDQQKFDIRIKENITDPIVNWMITIYSENNNRIFSIEKSEAIKESLTVNWDGKIDRNNIAKDGYYYATLLVNFKSGLKSESKTTMFSIDTVPPNVELLAISSIFSPNNDGYLDTLEILQKGSKEDIWEATITDEKGIIVWDKKYSGEPTKKEIWDGKDKRGNLLPNGKFIYTIKSTDKAGNKGEAKLDNIILKNITTTGYITVDNDRFSPNSDGLLDTITFKIVLSYDKDIEKLIFEIFDENNNIVRTITDNNFSLTNFIWDGKDNKGNIVKDGLYTARLSLIYNFGNRLIIESKKIISDTTGPDISMKLTPQIFSPDDDGFDDTITLNIDSYDLSGIKEWKLEILDTNNKAFKTYNGIGNITRRIIWDGKSDEGELVESAEEYPVKISAIDIVGNKIEKIVENINTDILVIKLPDGRLKIKISNIEFKPDSDEMTDNAKNQKVIQLLARALNKYRNHRITVEGHANRFREDLNETVAKNLSLARARRVSQELEKRGVARSRMTVIGKGFDEPLVPLVKGVDPDKLAKNRRVEFYLERM